MPPKKGHKSKNGGKNTGKKKITTAAESKSPTPPAEDNSAPANNSESAAASTWMPPSHTRSIQRNGPVVQYPPAPQMVDLAVRAHGGVPITEKTLKDALRQSQEDNEPDTGIEPRLLKMYQERKKAMAAEKSYRDSMNAERAAGSKVVGRSKQSKDAKAAWEKQKSRMKVDESWRMLKGNGTVRFRDRTDDMGAQGRYEDFLYYQNSGNRWDRLNNLKPPVERTAEAKKTPHRTSYLLDAASELEHQEWLHPLLDCFDIRGIGTDHYRQGLKDKVGNDITENNETPLVGPQELHLWNPTVRRRPVGLGRDENETWIPEPSDPNLDDAAIEQRRNEFENQTHADDPPDLVTHHERRQAELEHYAVLERPTTAAFQVLPGLASDGAARQRIVDSFDGLHTRTGVFISAKESSWDWRTSFDYLGRVKSGVQFPLSEERTKPNDDPDEGMSATANLGQKRIRDDDDDLISEPSDDEEAPAGAEPTTSRKVRARIEYPYPANEFRRGRRTWRFGELPRPVTVWAEETDGRRERHHLEIHKPSSVVDSPPRSPLQAAFDELQDVPIGFEMTDDRPMALGRRGGRNGGCTHHVECRAFWTHAPDECYFAYPEQPSRSEEAEDFVEWPMFDTDPAKDADSYVPQPGIDHYTNRLGDHYALAHNFGTDGPKWPRIGVRVPYEPMTFDDLRLKRNIEAAVARGAENGETNERVIADDAGQRGVHEVRSLAFPIIEEYQRGYGGDNDPPEPDGLPEPEGPQDDASDTDNGADTFHVSYMQLPPAPGGLEATAV